MYATTIFPDTKDVVLSMPGMRHLIAQLSREDATQLGWSTRAAPEPLTRFLGGVRDEVALQALISNVFEPRPTPHVVRDRFVSPQRLRDELDEVWRNDTADITALLPPAVADDVDFAIRVWIALVALALSTLQRSPDVMAQARGDDVDLARRGSPWRPHALMIAALEAAHRGDPPEQIGELAMRAFREAVSVRRHAKSIGIRIEPFYGQTGPERAERIERRAQRFRDSLTEEEDQAFQACLLEGRS